MFWKLNKTLPIHAFLVVVILGFSVWIIYILDRLLDNQKVNNHPTERHVFHQQNALVLWYFIGLLMLICSILAFYLPANIIIFGTIITLFTSIYLLIVSKMSYKNKLQHYKEPITSIVYVSAVFGTTILHNPLVFSLIIGIIFLLIVFQNLLLFSLLEFKKNTNSHNLAEHFGIKKSNNIIILITSLIVILGYYLIYFSTSDYQNSVVIIEMLMSISLLIINLFDNFFLVNDRYRWVGDSIFLLPLLIIL